MSDAELPHPSWDDSRLVVACLDGDQRAWAALVDKYKNLLFSILLRRGLDRDQAGDLFQAVWLEAYRDLGKLKRKGALRPWLVSMTRHKIYHWLQRRRRQEGLEVESPEDAEWADPSAPPPAILEQLERHQQIREAVAALDERCRRLIRMLFWELPPVPYRQLAARLGLAVGSIGFIRGRCLGRLEKQLRRLGVR